jgi:hypothetical protein
LEVFDPTGSRTRKFALDVALRGQLVGSRTEGVDRVVLVLRECLEVPDLSFQALRLLLAFGQGGTGLQFFRTCGSDGFLRICHGLGQGAGGGRDGVVVPSLVG